MRKWARLAVSIIICQLAGVVGSVFTLRSIGTWYAGLAKPFFTPPDYVFGPVWTTLYTLMGISLFLIWQSGVRKDEERSAIATFGAQLFLNVVWSGAFFGLQSALYGFMAIVLLWAMIALTILKFYKINRYAGMLLLPYIAWVTVASFLNYFILVLN